MSAFDSVVATTARPLPVIVLADTSGSMDGEKIGALNEALRQLADTFRDESRLQAEIHLALITFGGEARLHLPLTPAHQVETLPQMTANGITPLGAAFDIARGMLEDRDIIPSRAYRPTLVLISDGRPNDDWEPAFAALKDSERAKKATRMAMAIGSDADEAMLTAFINDPETPLFKADGARDIHRFFRAVSMSVTSRSRSANPNDAPKMDFADPPDDDDDFDL